MKWRSMLLSALALFIMFASRTSLAQAPLGTAFTYQGQLKSNGVAASGAYAMVFRLYSDANTGGQIGPTLSFDGIGSDPAPVAVNGGLFTVNLDFGPGAFAGSARWLAITVNGMPLSPRQVLNPSPNAIYASNTPWSGVIGAPNSLPPNGTAGGSLTGSYPSPTINNNAVSSGMLATDPNSLTKVSGGALFTTGSFVGLGTTLPAAPLEVVGNADPYLGAITAYQTTGSTYGAGVCGNSILPGGTGVLGVSNASSLTSPCCGVCGLSGVPNGIGLQGWAYNNNGVTYGVYGRADSSAGFAGYFQGRGCFTGNVGIGNSAPAALLDVRGDSSGSTGVVYAVQTGGSLSAAAVYGLSTLYDGNGVIGEANTGNAPYAIWGKTTVASGYAGFFTGNVQVTGSLSKSGGSFRIDHPLDPEHKFLLHSFVESPDMMNIYNGNTTTDDQGYAEVTMPAWFEALNRDFRYQLTVMDEGDSAEFVQVKIVHKIAKGKFTLRSSAPHVEVSWQVTGVRQDKWANAHRISVEVVKSSAEVGHYIHPELYGAGREKAIEAVYHPSAPAPKAGPFIANPLSRQHRE